MPFTGKSRLFSLIFSATLAVSACGDDEEPTGSDDAGTPSDDDSGTSRDASSAQTRDYTGTLVSILSPDDSNPIPIPHVVKLFDSDTGEPLSPPVEGTTGANGKVTLALPAGVNVGVHIVGKGAATDDTSTYDSLLLNLNPDSGDTLFRISTVGLKDVSAMTTGVPGKDDRAAVSGAVYFAPGGTVRKGAIGCAKLYLDGNTVQDVDATQAYVGSSGLPVAPADLTQTLRGRGQFYFGNMTAGKHTLKVSMDGGETFIATSDFFVPLTRKQAEGPAKTVLYVLGIDVDIATNPTPADCPDKE